RPRDQEGQFRIANRPAGSYFAVAVEYVPQGEWRDPAWLERVSKDATRFTLEEGATKALDLKPSGSGNFKVRKKSKPLTRTRTILVHNGTMLRQTILGAAICLVSFAPPAGAQEVQQQTIRIGAAGGDGGPAPLLPPGRAPKIGAGRLRGRVIAGDTGSAVRRAQVRISSPDIGTKTALTDTQGRYEFRDLPAGRFNVSVSKSGYVTMQYGQNRPFERGR